MRVVSDVTAVTRSATGAMRGRRERGGRRASRGRAMCWGRSLTVQRLRSGHSLMVAIAAIAEAASTRIPALDGREWPGGPYRRAGPTKTGGPYHTDMEESPGRYGT